jgi:outer membrane protein OmpA-like peptidoglycan-associated protein
MRKTIAVVTLIVGFVVIGGLKFLSVDKIEDLTASTSDAGAFKHTIRIGVDSWVGYYPLCSKYLRTALRNEGIQVICHSSADVAERFQMLKKQELEMAASSVDAYLGLGGKTQFPGSIIAVIDESKGGDALFCNREAASTVDEIKLNPALRIALVSDSPSEHLVRSLAVHFDIPTLKHRGSWMLPTKGSNEAFESIVNGRVDCAVLWEPDVTRALNNKDMVKVIGSEDTERLIVDVLLANRHWLQKNPELSNTVMKAYFDTLAYYQHNPDSLAAELQRETKLDKKSVLTMLGGVRWVHLAENAINWYANDEYLVDTISNAKRVLVESGRNSEELLPNDDPYAILSSKEVTQLFSLSGNLPAEQVDNAKVFLRLSEKQWLSLPNVGTLKVRNVHFQSSSSELSLDAKRMLDEANNDLSHYPNFRVMIKGHTGLGGDDDANRELSSQRAKMVTRYLNIIHGVDENRLLSIGVGADEPLSQLPNEGLRSYRSRLSRVEIILKAVR